MTNEQRKLPIVKAGDVVYVRYLKPLRYEGPIKVYKWSKKGVLVCHTDNARDAYYLPYWLTEAQFKALGVVAEPWQ